MVRCDVGIGSEASAVWMGVRRRLDSIFRAAGSVIPSVSGGSQMFGAVAGLVAVDGFSEAHGVFAERFVRTVFRKRNGSDGVAERNAIVTAPLQSSNSG